MPRVKTPRCISDGENFITRCGKPSAPGERNADDLAAVSPEEVLDALNVAQPSDARRALASRQEQRRQKVSVPFDRMQRNDASETPQLALQSPRSEPPRAHRADARKSPASLGAEARRLLEALGHAPATLEILAQRTDMTEAVLQGTLLQLELAGHLDALPGGWFVRASRG